MATGTVRGVKARLDLKKIEQEEKIEVIATVTGKDGPLKEIGLVFFLNVNPISEIEETNPFGRASLTFEKPDPGNYEITAQATEGDLRESISLVVKKQREQTEEEKVEATLQHQLKIAQLQRELEETIKRPPPEPELLPDWFDGHEVGAPGRPKFIVSVYTTGKDGKRRGCKGRVKIVEGETGKEFSFSTNEHGDAIYPPDDAPIIQREDAVYLMRVEGVEREETFKKEAPSHYGPAHLGRVALCWIVLMGWLVFHFVTLGISASDAQRENERKIRAYQEYQNLNDRDRFYFERSLRLRGKPIPTKPAAYQAAPPAKEFFPYEGTLRWLWLGWCIGYTCVSIWKMISRAWTRVQRLATERRAGTPEYLGRQTHTQEQGLRQTNHHVREASWKGTLRDVWQEIVADMAAHEVRQRFFKR